MKKIGRDVSAAEYWQNEGNDYHSVIGNAYHAHRLGVVRSLISEKPSTVLDFGCGDGVMLADFPTAHCIGIEPDESLLAAARAKFPRATLLYGGAAQMTNVDTGSVDLLLCLNVLAYMSDEEDRFFYQEARRVLRPNGTLLVTHSNELFDLFSLNAYTVDFFRRYFECDPSSMLRYADKPDVATYNIRENPLTYSRKLLRYGFREDQQAFINMHERPPMLGKDDSAFRDTLALPEDQQWILRFMCSTFASRSRRF